LEDKLRKTKKRITALFIFILAVGIAQYIADIFSLQYVYICRIIMCITPFALFLMKSLSKGLINFTIDKDSEEQCSVLIVLIVSLISPTFSAVSKIDKLIGGLLTPFIILTALLLIAAVVSGGKHVSKEWIITFLLVFAPWYGFITSLNINTLGKQELVETLPVKIIDKYINSGSGKSKGNTYYIKLEPNLTKFSLTVSRKFYEAVEKGQKINIDIYKELLGIKYIDCETII